MRYYIADQHFCHGNLNEKMDCRGFSSTEEMNEYMITQWNSRVRANDEVIILGDFCISTTGKEVNEILARLKGRKYLIVGNHDKYIERRSFDRSHFKGIETYKELKDNKRKVILSHYPIMCYNGQYHYNGGEESTTYMLYGHVHNTYDEILINDYIKEATSRRRLIDNMSREVTIPCNMINCFCMFSDYVPLTLDEWIEVDKKRRESLP
ncbi:MAG: metallophosphoesterase family protein [Lachnospiraceae bacterium]|nr:metallophosphoesterase family protein [Lachnospiraceae bacterium]